MRIEPEKWGEKQAVEKVEEDSGGVRQGMRGMLTPPGNERPPESNQRTLILCQHAEPPWILGCGQARTLKTNRVESWLVEACDRKEEGGSSSMMRVEAFSRPYGTYEMPNWRPQR